jgi:hypothetical protein
MKGISGFQSRGFNFGKQLTDRGGYFLMKDAAKNVKGTDHKQPHTKRPFIRGFE